MNQKGFVALISVLIISAVTLALVTSIATIAIGEGQSSVNTLQGEDTYNFVETCAEDALMKMNTSNSYTGGTTTTPTGTCNITISKNGNDWTITATNTTNTHHKKTIEVKATRGTIITITSWKEI